MNTFFLLMAQYNARAIIPLDTVVKDYFSHLTVPKFLQKTGSGEILLPIVRMETSQKSAKGVHLVDLANYLDKRSDAARKELKLITS